MVKNITGKKSGAVETSFIESFFYPKFGPGHLWQSVAKQIENKGGEILLNHKVSRIIKKDNRIVAVETIDKKGNKTIIGKDQK